MIHTQEKPMTNKSPTLTQRGLVALSGDILDRIRGHRAKTDNAIVTLYDRATMTAIYAVVRGDAISSCGISWPLPEAEARAQHAQNAVHATYLPSCTAVFDVIEPASVN
jgi:hypothetical protein